VSVRGLRLSVDGNVALRVAKRCGSIRLAGLLFASRVICQERAEEPRLSGTRIGRLLFDDALMSSLLERNRFAYRAIPSVRPGFSSVACMHPVIPDHLDSGFPRQNVRAMPAFRAVCSTIAADACAGGGRRQPLYMYI
jgi:hypothetical protein